MKRLALALLSAVVLASPAFALVGGPWDGNVPGNPTPVNPSTANGTYQAVIKGQKGSNITGIAMFGTADASSASSYSSTWSTSGSNSWTYTSTYASAQGMGTSGNEGRFILFVNGQMAIGMLSTVINLPGKKISGVLEGSANSGIKTYTANLAPIETIQTQSTTTTTSSTSGTTTMTTVTPITQTITPRVITYTVTDVTNITGSFDASLAFPQLTFTGKGVIQLSSIDLANLQTQITAAAAASFDNTGNSPGSVYPQTVTTAKTIKISGLRTSTQTPGFRGTLTIAQPEVSVKIDNTTLN